MMIAPYPGKPAEPPRTYYIDSPMYGEPSDSYNSGGYLMPISVPTSRSNPIGGTACPQDAMLCPDGSWAERSGPSCEFICLGTSSDGVRGMMGNFGNFGSIVQLGVTRTDDGMRNRGFISNIFDVDSWLGGGRNVIVDDRVSVAVEPACFGAFPDTSSRGWLSIFFSRLQNILGLCVDSGNYGDVIDDGNDDDIFTTGDETFNASPTAGNAPLLVRFSSSLTEPAQYSVNFGDGESARYKICAESYPYQCSLSHTYRLPGTYTAQLSRSLCPQNAEGCLAPEMLVASITIRVR